MRSASFKQCSIGIFKLSDVRLLPSDHLPIEVPRAAHNAAGSLGMNCVVKLGVVRGRVSHERHDVTPRHAGFVELRDLGAAGTITSIMMLGFSQSRLGRL